MRNVTVIICFLIFQTVACAQQQQLTETCADFSLSCAIDQFDKLYSDDYDRFWFIFRTAGQNAIGCVSIESVDSFLEVAKVKKGNAEFNEYFCEVIEKKLIKENPDCFIKSMTNISDEAKMVIIRDLQHPLYIQKTEIDRIMEELKKDDQYKEIIELYFVGCQK